MILTKIKKFFFKEENKLEQEQIVYEIGSIINYKDIPCLILKEHEDYHTDIKVYEILHKNKTCFVWKMDKEFVKRTGMFKYTHKSGKKGWWRINSYSKYYFIGKPDVDSLLHKEDGPAVEDFNEDCPGEQWYFNGKRHRIGGPAKTRYRSGLLSVEEYYINGFYFNDSHQYKLALDNLEDFYKNPRKYIKE